MSWFHGAVAGLSFACCLVALLGRRWGEAAHWLGTGLYALGYALSAALGGA